MQPTTKEDLTMRAAALSRNAPMEWQAFVKALAVYTEVHRNNLVKSPMEELPVNQGRAQALSSLLGLLKNPEPVADKLRKNQ